MALTGNAHIAAGTSQSIEEVLAILEKEGEARRGSPDLFARAYNNLGVDDAREIRERARLRPVSALRRSFVIAASSVTKEAQNALLKVFEEPPANALFVLIVPMPETLLPTLRSRVQSLELVSGAIERMIDVKEFLNSPKKKRLELLKPLLEKGDSDKRDLGPILTFLSDLERNLAMSIAKPESSRALASIYMARMYIGDKGALMKPLLEQAALLVP